MILPLLMNMALGSGALLVEEDAKDIKLVTKKIGATVVLAKMSKEAFYQMVRDPEMPATLAEAIAAAPASEEKVLASAPVPLPTQKTARQRPALSVVQGGRA